MSFNENQSTKRSIKGIVDIKVFDKNGKLKQHETGENMITNYYKDLLASYFDPVWRTLLSTDKSPFLNINKTITKHSKGILLFGNKLIENADNYMDQLVTSTEIGHAGDAVNTYSSNKLGAFNDSAYINDESGITYQWVFGENSAVGTIKSVGLCNTLLGNTGLYDPVIYWNSIGSYNRLNPAYETGRPDMNYKTADGTSVSILGMYGTYLYGYIYNKDTATLSLYRYNTEDIYKIKSTYEKVSFSETTYNPGTLVLDHYKDVVLTINETTNVLTYLLTMILIDDVIFVFTNNSYNNKKIYCHKVALNTDIHSYTDLLFDVHGDPFNGNYKYYASNYTCFGICKKNNKLYVLRVTGVDSGKKMMQYSLSTLNYEQDVDLPLDKFKKPDGTETLPNRIFPYTQDSFTLYCTTNKLQLGIISDGVNFNIMHFNNNTFKRYKQNLMQIVNSNAANACISNLSLFTIKNLSGDVVKEATDTMIVTYRLINT